MCGRFNVSDNPSIRDFMEKMEMHPFPELPPRFNVTPGSKLHVCDQNQVTEMEWGIDFGSFKHPNTRVGTLKRKKELQDLLFRNRCVVPVNGFYEWPDKKYRPEFRNVKTRFYIHTPEKIMFCGGFYHHNSAGLPQFNVLTTQPNAEIDAFHHRMPVILSPQKIKTWLQTRNLNDLFRLMIPYEDELTIYECDAHVDNGRNEGPKCVMPKTADHDSMQISGNQQLSLF